MLSNFFILMTMVFQTIIYNVQLIEIATGVPILSIIIGLLVLRLILWGLTIYNNGVKED
jgi:hypothetical protein